MQAAIRNELRLAVPMDSRSLAELRWRTWSYLAAAEIASGMIEDILIALHEAVANALLHSDADGDIAVRVKTRQTSVVIEVIDQGTGIDSRLVLPPHPPGLTAERGRGLFMIWSLMSSVRLLPGSGTHLVMVKELYPSRV